MQPDKAWEVDLQDLEDQIDSNVAAIVINNPSNPCGSVYSKQHLLDILSIAEKHRVPIIADEVYADMVSSFRAQTPRNSSYKTSPKYILPGT